MIHLRSEKTLKFLINRIIQNKSQNSAYNLCTKNLKNSVLYQFTFDEISSTMTFSEQWPRQEIEAKQIFMFRALTQKSGKGQHTNNWASPMGNLYMTLLFKCNIQKLAVLSMVALTSVCRALKIVESNIQLKIKWINDIFLKDKKLCGILIKTSIIGKQAYCQMGIGLNILYAPLQTSTCLADHLKQKVNIQQLIQTIVQVLLQMMSLENQQIMDQYQKWLIYLNEEVVIMDESLQKVLCTGIFTGVDQNGFAKLIGHPQSISKGRMRKYQAPKQVLGSFFENQKDKKIIL